MHSVKNFALGLLAAAAVATASDVVELKKDTFDEFVKANDIVLAECTSSPLFYLILIPLIDIIAF